MPGQEAPDKLALLWASERGEEVRATFGDLKEETDRTASYFRSLHRTRRQGDPVLKRHYQWWLSMLGLCKIGAVAIPTTHMVTSKDIEYRNNRHR
jgi:acetyl-CoA synthetase